MSDPVTNAEVEDVLSSIRRLVSEDKRPVQATKAEPKSDRLVLTPALRVSEEVEPQEVPAPPMASDTPVPDAPLLKDEKAENAVETDISISSILSDDTLLDVFESETVEPAEPTDQPLEKTVVETTKEYADNRTDPLFNDPAHDYSADPYNFENDKDGDGEGETAHFLSTRALDAASPLDEKPVKAAPVEAEKPKDKPLDDDLIAKLNEIEATPEVQSVSNPEAKAAALTAKIAALETAIGQIPESWEPDGAEENDFAGSELEAMVWEDEPRETDLQQQDEASSQEQEPAIDVAEVTQVEPEAQPTVEAEPSDQETVAAAPPPSSDTFEYSEDTQLIDEDALRDLVAEIVRAELQSDLGERITRNVRKLVRREIHRALAAQDLE